MSDCYSCDEDPGLRTFGVQGDRDPGPESAKAIETIIQAAYHRMKSEEGQECPKSQRDCGHHCNCSWVHDHCHWCGKEWGAS